MQRFDNILNQSKGIYSKYFAHLEILKVNVEVLHIWQLKKVTKRVEIVIKAQKKEYQQLNLSLPYIRVSLAITWCLLSQTVYTVLKGNIFALPCAQGSVTLFTLTVSFMSPRIPLLLLGIALTLNCYSQSLLHPTGNSLINSIFSIDYSVGEIAISSIQDGNQLLTQGLIQPNYLVLSDHQPAFDLLFKFSCLPNPTNGNLDVNTDFPDFQYVEVFDITGKRIAETAFTPKLEVLNDLVPGTYFLRFCSTTLIKTAKIIKQ